MLTTEKPVNLVDQCVTDGVATVLRCSPYLALRLMRCSVTHGIVTLQGRLPSFYLKQIAQTRVCGVDGVLEVRSEIEVTD